jgi:predicted permease
MRRVFRIPFRRGNIAREVDDELTFHLEMRAQRLIAAGWSVDAARAEALRQFGDVANVRDHCVTMDQQRERAMHRANLFGELQQDIVYALRTLRRNVGFTAIIVAALALGIGANTAIFTLIDAVIVRSIPVSDPEQLVAIGDPARVSSFSQGSPRVDLLSTPLFNDLRSGARSFSDILASGRAGRLDAHLGESGAELEHPRGRFVSANYFRLLGISAARGRVFDGTEDQNVGGSPVATISYGYWTRRFHNDLSIIGRRIVIQGIKITIICVAPEAFTGEIVGASTDIWLPMTMHDAMMPNQKVLEDRASSWLLLLGRLAPGATLEQAREETKAVVQRSIVSHAKGAEGRAFLASKARWYIGSGARGFSRVRATFATPLLTLMIGVALLLCIICANVANLLLARAIARGREMAVRLALGAARNRLVRQLLTESVILAALGAAVGLLLAWWGSHALLVLASGGSTIPLALSLDVRVLVFTLAVSCGAVTLFGLVPALRASRVELASTMRANAHSVAGSALGQRGQRAPLGKLLIAGQVALSVVLLVGASMLVRSLRNVQSVELGLDRDHLLIVDVDVNARGYADSRLATLALALRDRIAGVPGVATVTFSENGIFSGTESGTNIEIPGFVPRAPSDTEIAYDVIGPDYVRGIGGHLLQGRDLTASDGARGLSGVALLNQSAARFYFPNGNAVGQFVHYRDSVAIQIVGVLADTRDHELTAPPVRRIYFPYLISDTANAAPGSLRLEVLTRGDPAALVQHVRNAVVSVDPELPIDGVDPLSTLMSQSIREERLVAQLATSFGALALLLAGIGLYGVMTYAITRRTGEIGLRAALGAARADVVRMVLFDALRLVGAGMVVGSALAIASTRLLRTQLHGIGAIDPASIAAAIGVLAISAVVAVLVPALRASRVSPIVALRAE